MDEKKKEDLKHTLGAAALGIGVEVVREHRQDLVRIGGSLLSKAARLLAEVPVGFGPPSEGPVAAARRAAGEQQTREGSAQHAEEAAEEGAADAEAIELDGEH